MHLTEIPMCKNAGYFSLTHSYDFMALVLEVFETGTKEEVYVPNVSECSPCYQAFDFVFVSEMTGFLASHISSDEKKYVLI